MGVKLVKFLKSPHNLSVYDYQTPRRRRKQVSLKMIFYQTSPT